jgi:hypothetical protein
MIFSYRGNEDLLSCHLARLQHRLSGDPQDCRASLVPDTSQVSEYMCTATLRGQQGLDGPRNQSCPVCTHVQPTSQHYRASLVPDKVRSACTRPQKPSQHCRASLVQDTIMVTFRTAGPAQRPFIDRPAARSAVCLSWLGSI